MAYTEMGKMSLPVSCLISAARLIWENFQQTLQKLVSTLLMTLLSLYTHIYLSMWTNMQREGSSLFTIIVFLILWGNWDLLAVPIRSAFAVSIEYYPPERGKAGRGVLSCGCCAQRCRTCLSPGICKPHLCHRQTPLC